MDIETIIGLLKQALRCFKSKRKAMTTLINEHGEKIYAVGQDGSPARMREMYPDTILELIYCIKGYYTLEKISTWADVDKYLRERDIGEIMKKNGVKKEDYPMLLTAAEYYAKNP